MSRVAAYRGDPFTRTTTEYEVHFADGTVMWQPFSEDLFSTVPFEDFVRSRPELFPLIYRASVAKTMVQQLNRTPITAVRPGMRVYVDLRSYSATWYQSLGLPDCDHRTYVVLYQYTKWASPKHLRIVAVCPIFNEQFTVDHCFVRCYGSNSIFDEATMSLVDQHFIVAHPQVLPNRP